MKLNTHFFGAGDLQKAQRLIPVEGDLRICRIMTYDDLIIPGKFYHFLEKAPVRHSACGVIGIV